MTVKTVAVLGAGTIGRGVALSLAATGHEVVLVDTAPQILEAAVAGIRREMRLSRLLGGQTGTDDTATLARIEPTTDYQRLTAVDFVIENTVEDWDVKSEVYTLVGQLCAPGTVVAANTSCIPVTRLASRTSRPDEVLGMHFMNPVPLKPVVEMVRGTHTSEATIERARRLLAQMGKEGILVADSPGFVSNRVLMLSVNEAAFLVYEKVAEPAEIDRIFTTCFGHSMGMLATADLIGLDTVLRSIEMLHESFKDSKYRPCPLLRQMVDAGHLGRKSGRGFYSYPQPA
ncbi:3-hydroxyacyl-CoA dehydrogenase family protein [Streptomyces sp. NPDC001348]